MRGFDLWRDAQIVFWVVGALWSWYMVNSNNKYFKIRVQDEKNTISCNLVMWFVLMIMCVVKCARMFM